VASKGEYSIDKINADGDFTFFIVSDVDRTIAFYEARRGCQ
jgi:hypothetical protein